MIGGTLMTIDGVASYGEIYSENLTDEDIKNFDDFGVEWRGRNIYEIRNDFCIKAIVVFAGAYLETARTNPEKLPELKAEIVQIFEDLFESETDEDDEPSPLLYRFDPISGTYLELIGAEKKRLKKIGKGFKKSSAALNFSNDASIALSLTIFSNASATALSKLPVFDSWAMS